MTQPYESPPKHSSLPVVALTESPQFKSTTDRERASNYDIRVLPFQGKTHIRPFTHFVFHFLFRCTLHTYSQLHSDRH